MKLVFIVVIAFLAVPSVARGDIRQFTPRFYSFEGELEFDANQESSKNTTQGKGLETSSTYFAEKIVLTANGFVYHPRFLLFLANIGGGLSQESFKSNVGTDSGGWRNVYFSEFQIRALMLPEHPYNLELFALRMNPFIPGRITWGVQPVSISEGAMFTYKRQPMTFRSGYTLTTTESASATTDTDTFHANAGYSIENFSLAGAYSRTHSQTSAGPGGSGITGEQYSLHNQIRVFEKKIILVSDVSWNISDARNVTASLNGDRFSWTEGLDMSLPWEFEARLNYSHFEDNERSLAGESDTETESTSKNDSAGFSLTKKLYESLSAAYNYGYSSARTSTGDFTNSTHALSGTYTKKIPGGRITAGGFFSRARTEQNGAPVVSNELHNAKILDEFALNGTDIDETSIGINVRNPVTGAFAILQRDTDYRVLRVGNTTRIQILTVPPGVADPDPSFLYEFRATYLFVLESAGTETTGVGYSLKMELFEGFFNPYYGYSHSTQKILSGSLSGGPEDATTKTAGVLLQRAPYYLLLEHQENQSNVNPSRQDRGEASYRKEVTPTTNLNVRAYYLKVKNIESASQPAPIGETGKGGEISIRQTFPRRNLTFNATGSYQQRKSTFETKTLSMSADLSWKVGKLDLGLGAIVGHTGTGLDTGTQESIHQRYYLFLKRRLF